MTSPNGSGQSIGNSSAERVAEKLGLRVVADLADELDQRIVEQRLDDRRGSSRVDRVDLGRDLQRHACALRDLDRPIGPLLRRDAADEGEIARRGVSEKRKRSVGTPCGTVANQLADGSGVRWRRRSRPAELRPAAVRRRAGP